MPDAYTVKVVPCLSDNYAYIIHSSQTGGTALVDAPEADPIVSALRQEGWTLDTILITHHHDDHIQGIEQLRNEFDVTVIGHDRDRRRLPTLDREVADGSTFDLCGMTASVIDVSGHTVGHIAYIIPGAAFTADSLMALGCGRVFEGTPPMMWASLQKLACLPDSTLIYSGHEYTLANGEFALTIEPDNAELVDRMADIREKRSGNLPTVPTTLALEKATNPFLRAALPEVKDRVGMANASDAEVFAEIRKRKDRF
ncbi:MAG: hydroxyacylglutathione hydrolase [Rhodobacteraceae bacterium]|nr:hydroxyacylglutathione hydrolase [Paracoccaceae bacterium]